LSTERQRKKILENGRFFLLLKVEIRTKTKNGIEYIIKQKHGEPDRGKKFQQIAGANRQQNLPLAQLCVM